MQLKKLKLVNFRNYPDFEQNFDHLKTIIIGQNAQGKTNILEAINILATSQSDRAEKDNDLVSWDSEHALIFADIENKESKLDIALQINTSGRRKLKINGVSKKAPQADLLGNFFAVLFSCEDLYMIKGSPSTRRQWIDSVLSQLNPAYHKTLQTYQKSITQKNAALKRAQEERLSKKTAKEQIDIWNEQIVSLGSQIIHTRLTFLEEIKPIAYEFQRNISKQTEELSLEYKSTVTQNLDIDHIKTVFIQSLENSFETEFIRGQSLVGPHRDDLTILINKKEAKSFASQGQQRSIVLAIKLSELKVIENRKGEIPVLLLDDVFAELDEDRQDFLLHNLPENIQIFLTTTHISNLQKDLLEGAQILEVKNGKILVETKT